MLALAVPACGGDSASGSAGQVTIPTSAPSPVPTPSPTASPTPSPTPTPSSWAVAAAALYDTQPLIESCNAGALKSSVRVEMLGRVNALRALHDLPAVSYSVADDAQTAQTALMMAANRALSHAPPTNWLCYSAAGATGAGSSDLILGHGTGLSWSSEDDFLGLWLTEAGSADIGHRRWILDPFLGKISYGRVSQQVAGGTRVEAAALKVFGFASAPMAPSDMPDFVAYPFGDYPMRYFRESDHLSFSVVVNADNRSANVGVSFAGANVTVSGGDRTLTVTDVARDNLGFGLPNNLQWRVLGLAPNVTYTVEITGVSGAPRSRYEYRFRMIP